MRGTTAALALSLVTSGCAATPARTSTTTASLPAPETSALGTAIQLDCNAIGDDPPTPDRVVVLGRVALPSPSAPAIQTARQPQGAPPSQTYFAKAGLGVRSGTSWHLSVAPEDADHLRIGWGSPVKTPSTTVLPPEQCGPTLRTGWLWYPGGYWTDRPGCYAVVVHVSGRSQEVRVGVGAPCPGQQPPPQPSDS
jgi:hypothetical protein